MSPLPEYAARYGADAEAPAPAEMASEAFAAFLDGRDPLRAFRERFLFPGGGKGIYLCGNSLGLQPKSTRAAVLADLDQWSNLGVEGHFVDEAEVPWWTIEDIVHDQSARLLGAEPVEVVCANSLTVNLHLLCCAFYRPTAARFKILLEGHSFPSDEYALQSQARLHGFDPETALVRLWPREGEETLRDEDIAEAIRKEGASLAMVMMGAVQYYTGQLFDLKAIAHEAHAVGAVCGFNLAHAAGNVELSLHEDGVDFACWCSYKCVALVVVLVLVPLCCAGCSVAATCSSSSSPCYYFLTRLLSGTSTPAPGASLGCLCTSATPTSPSRSFPAFPGGGATNERPASTWAPSSCPSRARAGSSSPTLRPCR